MLFRSCRSSRWPATSGDPALVNQTGSPAFQRYNAGRLAMSVLALAWAAYAAFEAGDAALTPVISVLGVALGVLLVVVVRSGDRAVSRPFLYIQLALDTLLVSALSGVGGGLHSLFTLLYFPIIGAATWLLGRTGALLAASFAAVGFIGMLVSTGELEIGRAHV